MTATRIARASTAYLAVTAAETVATLLTVPVMTRHLSPTDYGLMLLITNIAAGVNLLFGFTLAQALPALWAGAASIDRRKATATTLLWAIAALSGSVYVLVAATGSGNALVAPAPVALAATASFLLALGLCLASLVRLEERPRLFATVQISALAIQTCLLLYLLVVRGGGLASLYAAMFAAGLMTAATYGFALRHLLLARFEWPILGEAVRIGARMLPWQLANLLAANSAGILLVRSGHVDQAGLFAVAAGAVAIFVSVSNSFINAWTPYVLLRHAEPDLRAMQLKVFAVYSSGLLVMAAALSLFAQDIFAIYLGSSFREAYHFVPPLVGAYSLFCFANAFSQGLQAKQGMEAYTWIGAASAAAFAATGLALIGRFGGYGLIVAMAAAFLTMLVLLQRASERLLPVGYPWLRHGLMWLAAIGVVAAIYGVGGTWRGEAVKVVAMLVVCGLPFGFGVMRRSDLIDIAALRPWRKD